MTETATAFWITAPRQGVLRTESLAPCSAGQVLVRTRYSAVSRGTETLIYAGGVPESQYEAMRAPFQSGAFPYPVKYGYSAVGQVAEGPETLIGRMVFCLHPHQDLFLVPQEAVLPLPESVPAARAVLAANCETALNAVWDAGPRPGDRITVIGAGVVGCLVAWLCSHLPGAEVTLVDLDPAKEMVALALGTSFASPAAAAGDRDLVFHASGQPEGLRTALAIAGLEALVVELSWFGSKEASLPLGESFHSRRLTLLSSQVGEVAPARRARRSRRDRLGIALSLLQDQRLDCLVTGESPFAELPQTMARLAEGPRGVLCHRIRYPEPEQPLTE